MANVVREFRDIESNLTDLYKSMALAARYGNQPMSEIKEMTSEELCRFNDGLLHWIKKENESGRNYSNRGATGG
jgi:hypothetical protein